MTRRSKVLEKSSDLPQVTQQLKPKAGCQKEGIGVETGTGEGSMEKTQLGLKLGGGDGRGWQGGRGRLSECSGSKSATCGASGLEFSRGSWKVLRQFPFQP